MNADCAGKLMLEWDDAQIVSSEFDCYDVMLMSLAVYYKVDYNYIFNWGWGFRYWREESEPVDKTMYNNIYVGKNHDIELEYLQRYLGIDIRGYDFEDIENPEKSIRENLQNNTPVCALSDTINCPWNPLYQKQSVKHCFIIIGMDGENYYIREPYFSAETLAVRKDMFNDTLIKSIMFVQFEKAGEFDFYEMMQDAFSYAYMYEHENYETICLFADDLAALTELDMKEKYAEEDIRYIGSLRAFKNISMSRRGLMKFLSEHSELVSTELLEILEKCIEQWVIALNRMMRIYMLRDQRQIGKVQKILRQIADLEKDFYHEAMKLVNSKKMRQ